MTLTIILILLALGTMFIGSNDMISTLLTTALLLLLTVPLGGFWWAIALVPAVFAAINRP